MKGVFYFALDRVDEEKVSIRMMMFSGYGIMALCYVAYVFAEAPIHVFDILGVLSFRETVINPSWSAVIAASLEE